MSNKATTSTGMCESCGRHKAVHRCVECGRLLCDERTCSTAEFHEYAAGEQATSFYCHACAAKPANRLNEEELSE